MRVRGNSIYHKLHTNGFQLIFIDNFFDKYVSWAQGHILAMPPGLTKWEINGEYIELVPAPHHIWSSRYRLHLINEMLFSFSSDFFMQGSDGGSVVFASTPAQVATTAPSPTVPRKTDFPSTGLPHRWGFQSFYEFNSIIGFMNNSINDYFSSFRVFLATDHLRWVAVQALFQTPQVNRHQRRPQRQHLHKRHKCRFVLNGFFSHLVW